MISPRKKYFKLEEIKKFEDDLKDNYLERKKYVIQSIENLKNKKFKDINEKYIEILKLICRDNTNKKILEIYLKFLKDNGDKIEKDIPKYEEELNYYKVCFNHEELKEKFQIDKNSEKDNFINFLKYINEIINNNNNNNDDDKLFGLYNSLNDRFKKISKFNQPIIDNENSELYFYKNYVLFLSFLCPIKFEKKKYIELIYNMNSKLNFIFEKKILEDTNIIENIEKFNYFIVALIKSIDKEEFECNINRLKEYSQKEYELIINQYNKIFKKYDSKEKFISINNILFYESDLSNLCYQNIIQKKTSKTYYNFNYLKKNNIYEENKESIKNFLLKIFNSSLFEEVSNILHKNKLNLFKEKAIIQDILDNHLFFYPLNIDSSGNTDKFSLNIYISTLTGNNIIFESYDDNKYEIFSKILKIGKIIDILIHEINHCIQVIYYFQSNGQFSTYTPERKNLKGREVEKLLFGKIISKLTLAEVLYILNLNNYNKNLKQFREGFEKINSLENLDDIEKNKGEFKDLIENIKQLYSHNNRSSYYNDLKNVIINKDRVNSIYITFPKGKRCTLGPSID